MSDSKLPPFPSVRRRAMPLALEPRVLFDAAAVETAAAVADAADGPAPDHPAVDAAALFAAPAVESRREAYFVDSSVSGYQALLDQAPQGAEVFIIDSSRSGLEQITQALMAAGGGFDAVHIVSHGAEGALRIGSDTLNQANLASFQQSLQALGSQLDADGDILLYGCDVAKNTDGANFLMQFATLTGADVAASTDATGGPGGDADLEVHSGVVTASSWSAVGLLENSLALDGVYVGREDGATGYQSGYALDGSGEWIVAGDSNGTGTNGVQVWKINGATRTLQTLAPSGIGNTYGQGVSIDGNTLVVAEPGRGSKGFIYVYQLDASGSNWVLRTPTGIDLNTVSGIGADRIGPWTDASYGSTQWIAISGNHIAVGIPNEGGNSGQVVWLADTSASLNWSSYASGAFNEPSGYNSDSSPRFGASVAIDEGVLVVGAPGADMDGDDGAYGAGNTGNQGAVFVYSWSAGSTGGPTSTVAMTLSGLGGSGVEGARFGAAVDIDYYNGKYTVAAGAPGEDGGRGEMYVYQTTNSNIATLGGASNIWGQTTGGGVDSYGLSIAVSQGRIMVGAPNHNASTDVAVWYYESSTNSWTGMDTNNPAGSGILVKTFTESTFGGNGAGKFGRGLAFVQGNIFAAGAPAYNSSAGTVAFYVVRTPVAVNDSFTVNENDGVISLDILNAGGGNTAGADIFGTESISATVVSVVSGSQNGSGAFLWNNTTRRLEYSPNGKFEYLSTGETATVTIRYEIGTTFKTQATVTITITGQNDAPVVDAGIANITKPLTNEPNGVPAGPSTATTGSFVIPNNAFFDIDQSDVLAFSVVSITPVSGSPALTPAQQSAFIFLNGTNNSVVNYNLAGLTANTAYQVTIRASDGKGGTVDTTFTFNIARANENPAVVGGGVPDYGDNSPSGDIVYEDDIFSQNLSGYFSDPDTTTGPYPESLTYTIVSQTGPGADWLTISSSGTLAGVPTNGNVGTHTIVVRATDIFGNYIQDTFTVKVTNTNDAPVLVNTIDQKTAIRGETFSFNVNTGQVAWNGTNQTIDDAGPYFSDVDNSTDDGRTPSSGDVITYRAFNAITGEEITTSSGGTGATSWLRFNGTTFTSSGNVTGTLGSKVTIRLEATDRIGGSGGPVGGTTTTLFEIGIFPRDGSGTIGGVVPTPEDGGRLGYDVAISSDNGRWAVVGEPGGNGGNGTVWIYHNNNYGTATSAPNWVLAAGVPADGFTTTATGAAMGTAVDISADGRYIIVGAPLENNGQGAVYYLSNTTQVAGGANGTWALSATKGVSPDAANGDRFGSAVAINENGSVVLVGAPLDDEAGTNAGAAYQFAWNAATGAGKRMPTFDAGESGSARAGDMYGSTVAFDQNMVVIGAYRDDHSGKVDAGSAYVYSTDNTSFVKLKKTENVGNSDYFGWSVDVESFDSRNRVVVVVGSYGDDTRNAKGVVTQENSGSVYVYRSDGMTADNGNGDNALTSLAYQTTLRAYDAQPLRNFGYAVAVDVEGDTAAGTLRIVVGSNVSGSAEGAAYAYQYHAGYGWLGQKFTAAAGGSTTLLANQFGYAVDIAGSRIIVGAPNADRPTDIGAAGLYYGLSVSSSPITNPLSGSVAKTVGSPDPAPVILASTSPSTPTVAGNEILLQGLVPDWNALLSPVSAWGVSNEDLLRVRLPGSDALTGTDFVASHASLDDPAADSYAEQALFDLRTLSAVPVSAPAPAGEGAEPAPANQEPAPAPEGEEPVAPVAHVLKSLSSQLEAVYASRSREAQRLLDSLSSLPG